MNMDMFIPTEIKKIETQPREKFYLFDLLHLIFFTFILNWTHEKDLLWDLKRLISVVDK